MWSKCFRNSDQRTHKSLLGLYPLRICSVPTRANIKIHGFINTYIYIYIFYCKKSVRCTAEEQKSTVGKVIGLVRMANGE